MCSVPYFKVTFPCRMIVVYVCWFLKINGRLEKYKATHDIFLGFPGGARVRTRLSVQEARCSGSGAPLEEGTATHSSVPSWRIPRMGPSGLQPAEWQRVGRDRSNCTARPRALQSAVAICLTWICLVFFSLCIYANVYNYFLKFAYHWLCCAYSFINCIRNHIFHERFIQSPLSIMVL